MPFNVAGARTAGYSDQEINNYLTSKGQTVTSPQPQQRGGSLLPLLGSIAGSLLGTPFGPAGFIGGGALGGSLGAAAGGDDILKEGALGGLGAGVGLGIGRVAGPVLSRVFGKGAQAAGQQVAQVGAQAGTRGISQGLAARTLAANFRIPPKLAPQINIQEALGQMVDDEVRIPYSIKGYQNLANQVTGDKGAITQAYRNAIPDLKTPINFDNALINVQQSLGLKGSLSIKERRETLSTIRNYLSGRNYPTPGTLTADDAWDVTRKLEKEGWRLVNKGVNELTPNPQLEDTGRAFLEVADDLTAQISRNLETEGLFPIIKQNAITALQRISPKLAQKAASAQNISQLRSIAAPYVNISRGAQMTLNRGETPFGMGSLALTSRVIGALGGGGLFGLPGAAAGAALAPTVQGFAAASEPALTGLAAKGMLGAGRLGGKLPQAGQIATQTTGQIGTRALAGGIPEAQAAESPPIEGQILPQQSDNPAQEQLRQAFFLAMLANPKQASTFKTIFEFGFPKSPAGTADREASLSVGERAVDDVLRQAKRGYGPIGGGVSSLLLQRFGGAGVPSDVVQRNTQYQLLRQSVVRALQGARMSDVDIKLALQYIPQITDTQNTANQKLKILKNFLSETRAYLKRLPRNPEVEVGGEQTLPLPANLGL